jgi:S-adenosylmethionine:tRNA ribosyltransferase-isomerase
MLVSDLDFHLPPELIAQTPAQPRDHSRLMVLRRGGALLHHRFYELPRLLRAGDLLVFNDTRVLRARLRGHKSSGGAVEALLLREHETNLWEALLKPSARIKPGTEITFVTLSGDIRVLATPMRRTPSGWMLRFNCENDVRALLPRLGEVPLPPYIHRAADDESQYQTVYAKARQGENPLDSSASPTAGLHFTPRLLDELRAGGIGFAFVTLGIGLGTFRPIQSDTLEGHEMHSEEFEVSPAASAIIEKQRERAGRVIAVGTTAARVLESASDENGLVPAQSGATQIFITPGYKFKAVDALITNFHLPRSTLVAMVAALCGNAPRAENQPPDALAGLEKIRYAYSQAVREGYRFFSFGDAMFIE